MQQNGYRTDLEQLGLSSAEARVYLALLENGVVGATAIASAAEVPRSSVYPTLCSLADKGMVEGGAGYGSRFTAIPPQAALPALVQREKQAVAQREQIASKLAEQLAPLAEPVNGITEELIQVLRTPQVISDRHDRLQLEADRTIDIITKPPIVNPSGDNPAQRKALQRGVRVRGLYERTTVEHPAIRPFLKGWIESGEHARVYDGELPHKLAIYDGHTVLLTLVMPGEQTRSVLIRHSHLARSLGIMFDSFWDQAEPISALIGGNGNDGQSSAGKGAGLRARSRGHHRTAGSKPA